MTRIARAFPQYSKSKVDAAGAILIIEAALSEDALTIINNWRASHSFPLNTFHIGLRRRVASHFSDAITSERIKRLSSREHKLRRFKTRLSQVQDIGGCRATVKDVGEVVRLVKMYELSSIRHQLDHKDDYILSPQSSGYRGVHLVYRYFSDKKTTYNGLKVEVQIRSQSQHAWATAVETVGTFIRQALKSSQGEADWLRFFALVGSAFAMREGTPLVPDTPTNSKELLAEIRDLATSLDVSQRLRAYGATLKTLEDPTAKRRAHYYLMQLDPKQQQVSLRGFHQSALQEASKAYLEAEKEVQTTPGAEAVLVSVNSLSTLRQAYPNYFLDTNRFLSELRNMMR